jgi:hypothetical protein
MDVVLLSGTILVVSNEQPTPKQGGNLYETISVQPRSFSELQPVESAEYASCINPVLRVHHQTIVPDGGLFIELGSSDYFQM